MNTASPKHYFMVGIGGIGMQALADVLVGLGHLVTGSNMVDFNERPRLEAKGIKVIIGPHNANNVSSDINELIYTSAIRSYSGGVNPEIDRAKELNIPVTKRSEFIGKLMADKVGIAVSGTHGKSTTSTIITAVLQEAGLMPTALIGAEVKSLKGCGIVGSGEYIVVEACEFDRSFLDMKPKIAVLTNIEEDHLDYYQDIHEIKEAFAQFLELVPETGLIVACGDDANIKEILPRAKAKIVTYGFNSDNNLIGKEVLYHDKLMSFRVDGLSASLHFPGRHLILDAMAAVAVAQHLGIDNQIISNALDKFKGAKRRFELLGQISGIDFVDDYGHHPTEIKAMLSAAREYFKDRKIRVVFQPHQFSRTKLLLKDFAKSFGDAEEVLVAPILPVRDSAEEQKSINSEKLVAEINSVSQNAKFMSDFDAVSKYLTENLKSGDVVVSLGAGKNSEWINEFIKQFTGPLPINHD